MSSPAGESDLTNAISTRMLLKIFPGKDLTEVLREYYPLLGKPDDVHDSTNTSLTLLEKFLGHLFENVNSGWRTVFPEDLGQVFSWKCLEERLQADGLGYIAPHHR